MALDDKFQEYFSALDRAGGEDRCYICRRTAKEVKHFFGFDEDGEPFDIELFGSRRFVEDHPAHRVILDAQLLSSRDACLTRRGYYSFFFE